jgi:hypothetical protein
MLFLQKGTSSQLQFHYNPWRNLRWSQQNIEQRLV